MYCKKHYKYINKSIVFKKKIKKKINACRYNIGVPTKPLFLSDTFNISKCPLRDF